MQKYHLFQGDWVNSQRRRVRGTPPGITAGDSEDLWNCVPPTRQCPAGLACARSFFRWHLTQVAFHQRECSISVFPCSHGLRMLRFAHDGLGALCRPRPPQFYVQLCLTCLGSGSPQGSSWRRGCSEKPRKTIGASAAPPTGALRIRESHSCRQVGAVAVPSARRTSCLSVGALSEAGAALASTSTPLPHPHPTEGNSVGRMVLALLGSEAPPFL